MLVFATNGFAQPYACLPTCDETDSRNFAMVGEGANTFTDNSFLFGISSPASFPEVELGFFDADEATSTGDVISNWDQGGSAVIVFKLYADPTGEGKKDQKIAEWYGDGSAGDNTGIQMPDGEWFNVTVPNTDLAKAASGNYRYTLSVELESVAAETINSFRVRTDGSMIIFQDTTFFMISQVITLSDFNDIYPNLVIPDSFSDPACFDAVTSDFACNLKDPGCCISGGPYDGSYTFILDVDEGEGSIEAWDGDFDFGSSTSNIPFVCIPDFVDVDTYDFNTPNSVPLFALGTDAVPEGVSSPSDPLDDSCVNFFKISPSVFYSVVSPDGDAYTNPNPSGTEEWELFLITSEGGGDVDLEDIPGGFWKIEVEGLDFVNTIGYRINFPVVAININGDPVEFDPPVEPIPTLNEWGLLSVAVIGLIISLLYLKRRKNAEAKV